MTKFEFSNVGRIVFGRGEFARLGEIVSAFGKSALVIQNVDGPLIARTGQLLCAAGIKHIVLAQHGEPKVEDVDRGIEAARAAGCEVVIGLGGGSAVDTAKAIAGLLTNGGAALDYMEVVGKGQKITRPGAPFIAIPTTAGTGAEVTRNAVIGYPPRQFKASIRSEHLLARVALVDPELGVGVPPAVTASSGVDALCQVIESYTSINAQPMTDALAMKGIELAARSLRRAVADGHDLDARQDMAMAAMLSGITLANAGLGAVHGFAAPLGANFPVPHGTACAILLPGVIAANVAAMRAQSAGHPTLARYAQVGRLLAGQAELSDAAAIDAAVEWTAQLVRDFAIPPPGRYGMTHTDVAAMVTLAKKASSMKYNPVVLPDEALAGVLRGAM